MSSSLSVWSQDKWRGQFTVKWIYVKDVPNAALRHIRLENNENKPVTNSRDTQEVPVEKGRQVTITTIFAIFSFCQSSIVAIETGVENSSYVPPCNIHF